MIFLILVSWTKPGLFPDIEVSQVGLKEWLNSVTEAVVERVEWEALCKWKLIYCFPEVLDCWVVSLERTGDAAYLI